MGIIYEIHGNGETYESRRRPEEGETWVFEKDGKWYQGKTVSVQSRGWVWDKVEALDVETVVRQLHPKEYAIDEKDGKKGVITGDGKVVVPYEYDLIEKTPIEPLVKVKKLGRWGVLNCYDDGKAIIPVNCIYILFLRGYIPYWLVLPEGWNEREDGGWKLYDLFFKPATLDSNFTKVRDLEGGFQVFRTNTNYSQSVVDKDQRIILPFAYKNITSFGDGLFLAYGKQSFEYSTDQIDAYYIYDAKGMQLGCWDRIWNPKDGMFKVSIDLFGHPKLGYINSKGNIVVSPIFDELSDFYSDGYAEGTIAWRREGSWPKPYETRYRVDRSGRVEVAPRSFIRSDDYSGVDGLTEVDIPAHVRFFASDVSCCFADCKNLKTVRISNSEKHQCIYRGMFSHCKSLEHVEIPDSVTLICSGAFRECVSLAHIELPPHLQELGDAFEGCSRLESITIPASVNKIVSGGGLDRCENLKEIIVDLANEHYTSIDGVLYDKAVEHLLVYPKNKETKALSIPSTVKAIDDNAFHEPKNLEKVIIPASVESIGVDTCDLFMKLGEIEVSWFCDELREAVMPDDILWFDKIVLGVHYGVLNKLTIVISRQMYNHIRERLPEGVDGVKIVFKD